MRIAASCGSPVSNDVVRMLFVELPVGKRPWEFAQIMDDIHAGQQFAKSLFFKP